MNVNFSLMLGSSLKVRVEFFAFLFLLELRFQFTSSNGLSNSDEFATIPSSLVSLNLHIIAKTPGAISTSHLFH